MQIELTLFNAEKDLFDQAANEVTKQLQQQEKFPELAKRALQTLVQIFRVASMSP